MSSLPKKLWWNSMYSRLHWIVIPAFFLITHIPFLLALPVFADEAIYIRWAQLIDDSKQYLFFSMADGKPPLFIWILNLWSKFFVDPLLAGRTLAVMIGLMTVYVIMQIVKVLGGGKWSQIISVIAVTLLPFWYFHHRMALMDGLLTLFIALALLFSLKIVDYTRKNEDHRVFTQPLVNRYVVLLALSFAGALMTKTPALFVIPIIAFLPILFTPTSKKRLIKTFFYLGIGGFFGCLLFASLRVSPLFGNLFKRSGDFTFTLSELLHGQWRYVLFSSLPRDLGWIITYLTPEFLLAAFVGMFCTKNKVEIRAMMISSALFALPLIALGRVLSPRYFLPCAVFLTVAGSLAIGSMMQQKKTRVLGVLIAFLMVVHSMEFIIPSWTKIGSIPFVQADSAQYLDEWSAGFGNAQVRDFIITKQHQHQYTQKHRLIVVTEGSFGTLPDGLIMYFHQKGSTNNTQIYGIGEPIRFLPTDLLNKAKDNDVYLMVNSDRLLINDPKHLHLVFSVLRPGNSPPLLFFHLTL